jgi:hypothetical protein
VSLAGRNRIRIDAVSAKRHEARLEDALRHDSPLSPGAAPKPLAGWVHRKRDKKKPATAAGGQDSRFFF